ncbi:beta-barrel assembly-enhancing protease [Methylophilus medardicus]|uniref:M48 family metallopeptidase n=1 Tax=Methylophilus medardicus TaxID=2588534 RepID=A0A5B8CUT6_9PROT|nr:M48 family metalloprotease [Methylophilus medardicus]QDC45071.1 M48 family metallopeptidase [Methylophilus medardicus]QDC50078.1 M48 family metallopeptidase [Methylophilus medardicus]QDC53783.1 M48 family metallopeptidase [Methylophilus medardicus]
MVLKHAQLTSRQTTQRIVRSVLLCGLLLAPALTGLANNATGVFSGKPYEPDSLDLTLPPDSSNQLPELGDASQTVLSLRDEEKIAHQILKQVATSEEVLDDAEVTDYLQALGTKLGESSPDRQQKFYFFVVQDKSINAFAMPGGVIGVHTGLFMAANNESELASVLGHEIGHVTQHHLARMLASQKYDMFKNIAATALALLIARSNPQVGMGAMTAASAAGVQKQLDYTREHEREADRVGLTILQDAGFDVRAMPAFFTTMQRVTRFSDGGNMPSYLRTHPLTSERIADIGNRVQNLPYKQINDSLPFFLMRAKIRAFQGAPQQMVEEFQNNINEGRFQNELAEHYGLAYAWLRANQARNAQTEVDWLVQHGMANPYLITLKAVTLAKLGQVPQAQAQFVQGLQQYPKHRMLAQGQAESLVRSQQWPQAVTFIQQQLETFAEDPKLYDWLASACQGMGKQMLRHQALGESYVRKYDLPRAIEQFEIASKAKDGDFYLQSRVEARLKTLRQQLKLEQGDDKNG